MDKQEFAELQKKFANDTKKRKYLKVLNLLTTFISVLGVSVLTYYFVSTIFIENNNSKQIESKILNENEALKKKIDYLQNKIKNANTSVSVGTPDEQRIVALEKKIESLNNIIIQTPEKSITIPLMSKDIENIRKNNELQIELVKDKVEMVIDLNKWILGLIFSLLITLVITNLTKTKSKNNIEE